MTPKQKYDERRRLRAERLLRDEQQKADVYRRQDETEEVIKRITDALERIADVLELWADKQEPAP
jgi:hypothetical protein